MSDQPEHPESEMDKLREELLNDPRVRIGRNVLRDYEREKAERKPPSAEASSDAVAA